ncbi:unnamed protein product, partial [Staurois parvus]
MVSPPLRDIYRIYNSYSNCFGAMLMLVDITIAIRNSDFSIVHFCMLVFIVLDRRFMTSFKFLLLSMSP